MILEGIRQQPGLTFENSHPAITAGSQTASYSSARLRGVPGDSMVLLREETPGFGKLATHKKDIFLLAKFPLVYDPHWLLVSSPNIDLLLECSPQLQVGSLSHLHKLTIDAS